jgi:hypothetical protein
MRTPKNEIAGMSREFMNERTSVLDGLHADQVALSKQIVNEHPELRSLTPKSYLA